VCVHATWAIISTYSFKRVCLLALVHARAHASKLASVNDYEFVIMLFLKLMPVEAFVQV
jgi:hypothetical protein